MKSVIPLVLALFVLVAAGDPMQLGSLNRDSQVMVPGIYPVFQLWVPEGITVTQIRASVNNFQSSFRLHKSGGTDYIFRCTGTRNARNYYEDAAGNPAWWAEGAWNFTVDGLTASDDVGFPWQCTTWNLGGFSAFRLDDDSRFVYKWCSTGDDAEEHWGQGVSDGDAALFFANQNGVSPTGSDAEISQQRLQRWLGNTADAPMGTDMTAQLQPAGTPGRFVIFQPSRSGHLLNGVNGDWMRQSNRALQWVVQYETVGGLESHPDGSEVWSPIRPSEWRGERLVLLEPK